MGNDELTAGGQAGRILAGVGIIVFGMLMLWDGNGVPVIRLSGHYWPVILIAFGLVRLIDPPQRAGKRRSRRSGAWLLFLGFWALSNEMQLFGLTYATSWPLLVIGAGAAMVWRAMESGAGTGCRRVREN